MLSKANNSKNGNNYNKEKWIFTTTSLHHTTLVLICIRFTCPRCYSEGQEDGLAGAQTWSTVRGNKSNTLLMFSGTSRSSFPLWAPMTRRLNSHTSAVHFWARVLTTSDIFLNIASCDFSSSVSVGGEGRCSVSRWARVTSHTHTTVCDTPGIDERPDLRRLSLAVWHRWDWSDSV